MDSDNPHTLTILQAEDDVADAFLLQRAFALEQVRNPLQTVRDGEEALAYLTGEGQFADRARYPLPGLLLLDMKMPKLNGLEVLRRSRPLRGLEALPVTFLTSAVVAIEVAEAYHLGAHFFILKPISFDDLREIVRFLKDWVLHMTPPPTVETDWIALTCHDLRNRWAQWHKTAA
jgi:CheY-like chemotaxis protein